MATASVEVAVNERGKEVMVGYAWLARTNQALCKHTASEELALN